MRESISHARPIVFFDLETTGINITKDRIIQFAAVKITGEKLNIMINPNIPISPEATEVHGITNDMLADKPLFSDVAEDIAKFIRNCDIAGFNINHFDVPFLFEELYRCNIHWDLNDVNILDSYTIECKLTPRSLESSYQRYFNKPIENAHDALADVEATIAVFKKQMELIESDEVEYLDKVNAFLGINPESRFDCAGKLYLKDGIPHWSFGKYKDKPITFDNSYVNWVLNAEFPTESKFKIIKYLGI